MTLPMGIVWMALLGLSAPLICPDGSMCKEKHTCCQSPDGTYGCCPLPNAVCCSDHLHCCYEGTECDLVHAKCLNKTVSLPLLRRLPAQQPMLTLQGVKAVICPDQESECPTGTTCCQLPDGSWGCCPMAKAVCCEDKLHCCPEGTQCDLTHSKCVSATLEYFPMLEKHPATKRKDKTGFSVTCPDSKHTCPDGSTCCLLISGDYGCCPYPEAVCCNDHLHCCPGNTTCDLEHEMCVSGETQVPLVRKIAGLPSDVKCPDEVSTCPDETTCCRMANGTYGCCPMLNAVCCSDHLHCCPEHTKCDLVHSKCVSAQGETSMATKMAATVNAPTAVQKTVHDVPCNSSVACADGHTCCKSPDGDWGCCPLPKAVCCEDHLHCCPQNTICNVAAQTCDDASGNAMVPWLDTLPTSMVLAVVSALSADAHGEKCDQQTMCPGGTTCCKQGSGHWACCPLPQAVCCSDNAHCCPKGYKCNIAQQTCDKPGHLILSWVKKMPTLPRSAGAPRPARNMCDAHTSCPDDNTCCFMKRDGKWGCCPLRNAICCADGDHCCPGGYTCDARRSSCSKGLHVVRWYTKQRTLSQPDAVGDVKCDDKSSCASGTTCCKLPTGEWGCCPLVKAVCCEDHEHCCPQGYTCAMQTGTCEKKAEDGTFHTVPLNKVVESKQRDAQVNKDIPCDGKGVFSCPEQHACCRTSATQWACCPTPKAVCCADSKHCCPVGYSCDLEAGGCIQQTRLNWDTLLRLKEQL